MLRLGGDSPHRILRALNGILRRGGLYGVGISPRKNEAATPAGTNGRKRALARTPGPLRACSPRRFREGRIVRRDGPTRAPLPRAAASRDLVAAPWTLFTRGRTGRGGPDPAVGLHYRVSRQRL